MPTSDGELARQALAGSQEAYRTLVARYASAAVNMAARLVNDRALALTRTNAAAFGNVSVARPDEVPDDVAFAGIYSNPPIRSGKAALHALMERWLPRLVPQGRAYLVVHKHLGADSFTTWLRGRGWPTTRLTSVQGYRILEVAPCSSSAAPR